MTATAQLPILIGENLQPLMALQQAQREVFKRTNAVKEAYESLSIGEFNQGVYSAVIGGRIEQIREQYLKEARQTVEALNIPNPRIRENLLTGTEELFSPFEDASKTLKASTYAPNQVSGPVPFPLEVVTIENGVPIIKEQEKEAFIEQRCRTYVSTPQEHRAFQKFKELEEAANRFTAMLKEAGVSVSAYNFSEFNQLLVKSEDGTISFKPDMVKWIAGKLK